MIPEKNKITIKWQAHLRPFFLIRTKWTQRIIIFLLVLLAGEFFNNVPFLTAQTENVSPVNEASSSETLTNRSPAALSQISAVPVHSIPSPRHNGVQIDEQMTFWLLDNNGQWKIPLPNWSIDDVIKSLNFTDKQKNDLPYAIQSLNATGTIHNDTLQMTIEYRVNTNDEAMVRVPLGLKEGVYLPSEEDSDLNFHYEGNGACYLDVDRQNGGYVAVIQNKSEDDEQSYSHPSEALRKLLNREAAINEKNNDKEQNDILDTENSDSNPEKNSPNESQDSSPSQNSVADDILDFWKISEEPYENRFAQNRHTLTLTLFFPIESNSNGDNRLQISFAAAVASKFLLEIPIPDAQITLSEGVQKLSLINLNETTSEVTLTGLSRTGAPTELVWRKKEKDSSKVPAVIQVEDAVIAVTPEEQGVLSNVTLPIRSFGESLNLIRIRLPESTHPIADSIQAVGANNSPIGLHWEEKRLETAPNKPSAPSVSEILEVRLAQPSDFITLNFKTMTQEDSSPLRETIQDEEGILTFTGFEVLGAQKQFGELKFLSPKEQDYNLNPERGIHASLQPSQEEDEGDHFVFSTQPFLLKAKPILRRMQMSVTPEYQILVQDTQIQLQARFLYTVHGSQIRQIRFQAADWFVRDYGGDTPVDTGQVYQDSQTGEWVFPLKAPMEGNIEIQWTAVREPGNEQDLLHIPIPIPSADWIGPASVTIVPDDNIELFPEEDKNVDLIAKDERSLKLNIEIPPRQQTPLFYQVTPSLSGQGKKVFSSSSTGDGEWSYPQFAARLVRHSQKIGVRSDLVLQILNQQDEMIQQTLNYSIRYVPIRHLSFLVPQNLKDNPAFTIAVDGKPVPLSNMFTEPAGDNYPGFFRKQINLPGNGTINTCQVSLTYPRGPLDLTLERTNIIPINFIIPEDGTLEFNRVKVVTTPQINIFQSNSSEKHWKNEETTNELGHREYTFLSHFRERSLSLRGIVQGETALGSTVIERLWIQSWLFAPNRLDRIACRVISSKETFSLFLPTQSRLDRLEVKLDGTPYFGENQNNEKFNAENNRLDIQIPEEKRGKSVKLEISYLLPYDKEYSTKDFKFPELGGPSVWIRRCYWQTILPENKHIIGEARGWTPEYYDLTWSGFFFRRVASMNQEELEKWIGISAAEKIPQETNVYLFSSFNPPEECHLQIVDRVFLIFSGSGIVLVLGLIFLYFPKIRFHEIISLVIFLLLGIFIFRPVVVLVFLQTSVVGVLLTFFAYFFKQFIHRHETTLLKVKEQSVLISPTPEFVPHNNEADETQSTQLLGEK